MMNPKKLIQAIDDSNRGRQERIYRLLVTIGLMGLAAGIISGIVAGENINNLIMMAFFFALSSGIVFFSILSFRCQHQNMYFLNTSESFIFHYYDANQKR